MMYARLLVAAYAVIASTLAAIGCGSSSSTTTSSSSAKDPTSAHRTAEVNTMVAEANAICMRLNAKKGAAPPASTEQAVGRVAPKVAADERTAVAELRKLTPPATMASDWKQILADAETLTAGTARLGAYAQANDLVGAQPMIRASQQAQKQMSALAETDGFKECARWTRGRTD
jgi:hypothetical protein